MRELKQQLEQKRQQGLYRQRHVSMGPQGREITLDGNRLLNFCSNDYLGLANHPKVNAAFVEASRQYGVGSGAAHLVNGHTQAHHALEEELAEFSGFARCLLFSTGYMANLGLAQSLCSRGDTLLEDRLNHASLLDAAQLSGARLSRFAHLDYAQLAHKLESTRNPQLVSSDAVFSMDGDQADIQQLINTCKPYSSWLLLDDAHGFGVLGKQGRGSLHHQSIQAHSQLAYMATLGKALGTAGAFIAGPDELIEYLIQTARTYIFTTAMPAAIAEASRASLRLLVEETWRQQQLQQHISHFRKLARQAGLQLMDSQTPIQPVIIGAASRATAISQKLYERGLHIAAIRPPTVPENTARLRITLRADHTDADILQLVEQLAECLSGSEPG